MPLNGAINGVVGLVRWGYYTAAAIEGYAVTRNGDEWTVTATVILSDAFKMSRQPLLFVAPIKGGEWRWPIRSYQLVNGQLTAQLGPPEEVSHAVPVRTA